MGTFDHQVVTIIPASADRKSKISTAVYRCERPIDGWVEIVCYVVTYQHSNPEAVYNEINTGSDYSVVTRKSRRL